jgi:hypothetical protein
MVRSNVARATMELTVAGPEPRCARAPAGVIKVSGPLHTGASAAVDSVREVAGRATVLGVMLCAMAAVPTTRVKARLNCPTR